jgi:hypothetical protein
MVTTDPAASGNSLVVPSGSWTVTSWSVDG